MRKRVGVILFLTLLSFLTTAKLYSASSNTNANEEEDDSIEVKKTNHGKEKQLTLALGISKIIEFQFEVGSIYVGDPSLFDFQRIKVGDKDRKLRLVPKNPGYTDMTIHDQTGAPKVTYFVRVTREDMGEVISELDNLVGDIEGIQIKPVGGTVVIDGDILLPKDMLRIMRVVDAMKDRDPKKKEVPIKNLANISKITMNIIAERIEREINSPEISARVLNNNILLEGTADSEFDADRAVEIAKTYLPEAFVSKNSGEGGKVEPRKAGGEGGGLPTIIDFLRVRPRQAPPPAQDIKITMNYVELDNDYAKNFNFEWKPLYTDGASVKYDSTVGDITANFVATLSSLLPTLNSLKNHGHARILKQEQLIVKDKAEQPATIESSLQIYASSVDQLGVRSLQAIPVQNVTKVRAATVAGSDSIELGIQITLNQFLGTNGGSPIVSTNSLQTQVTVKNGDSAALGGYALDNMTSDYNRAPNAKSGGGTGGAGGGAGGASGASATGGTALFDFQRSKSYNRTKQQFIIFVTPEVIRTAGAATDDMSRKFRLNAGEK